MVYRVFRECLPERLANLAFALVLSIHLRCQGIYSKFINSLLAGLIPVFVLAGSIRLACSSFIVASSLVRDFS